MRKFYLKNLHSGEVMECVQKGIGQPIEYRVIFSPRPEFAGIRGRLNPDFFEAMYGEILDFYIKEEM
jgi:hypothetical protein